MERQEIILGLLDVAQLISPETKNKIRIGYRHLNDEQLDKVISILKTAVQK